MTTRQTELRFEQPGADADLLARLFEHADQVLVKKLSRNDRDWARLSNKHQAGVYIPHEQRDSGFFPPLQTKERGTSGGDEIREAYFVTVWPQAGNEEKHTRLVHYTSKGPETHMTRVPKAPFSDLLPASFLVMGRIKTGAEYCYECITVDSASDEAALLADMFDLDADFLIGVYEPAARKAEERDRILDFAEQVIAAWSAGDIETFARNSAAMPATVELARMARVKFIEDRNIESLNPFRMEAPGDALREISRTIEWELFREYQRRERSVELVRLVLGDNPITVTVADMIRRLIDEHSAIDALMLSASQQRKSRAGYSYEHHIEAMLIDGNIPFEKQVVLDSRKRPDFILPSLAFVDAGNKAARTGMILSAKTTLRERWKQVEREMGGRRLFLATVDENISGAAIEDMASIGIQLVIPEALKRSKEAEYKGHANVLSFKAFCTDQISPNLTLWQS